MGIFPSINTDLQTQLNNINQTSATTNISKKSFLFDFSKGEFVVKDGNVLVIEGVEALKVWIVKILKTEKFKFKIYETDTVNEYGASLLELVNSGYPKSFVESELKREITEALLRNSNIKSVNSFDFSRDKRTLIVNFIVNSIYGAVEMEVSV